MCGVLPEARGTGGEMNEELPKGVPMPVSGSPPDSSPAATAEANRRLRRTPTFSALDKQGITRPDFVCRQLPRGGSEHHDRLQSAHSGVLLTIIS